MAGSQQRVIKHIYKHLVDSARNVNKPIKSGCVLPFIYQHVICRHYHLIKRNIALDQPTALNTAIQMYKGLKIFNKQRIHNYLRLYSTGTKKSSDYYKVLGVKRNATQKQIKSAYYMLSKTHHPDIEKDDEKNMLFLEITEAYEVLGNIKKRRMYDRGVYKPQQHMHEEKRYDDEDDDGQEPEYPSDPFKPKDRPLKRKIYTGRSKIYNFDEHFEQHYRHLRERKANNEYNIRQHEERVKAHHRGIAEHKVFMIILGLIAFLMLTMRV